jgi:hypothetical protein
MGHPEVRSLVGSSCCSHNRHLLSISFFKILFLKQFVLTAWSWAAKIALRRFGHACFMFLLWCVQIKTFRIREPHNVGCSLHYCRFRKIKNYESGIIRDTNIVAHDAILLSKYLPKFGKGLLSPFQWLSSLPLLHHRSLQNKLCLCITCTTYIHSHMYTLHLHWQVLICC